MQGKNLLIPALSAVTAAAVAVAVVTVMNSRVEKEDEPMTTNRVGYASEGVTVVDDENALAKAVEEAVRSASQGITLSFKNEAFSDDGRTFTCFVANDIQNEYDAYLEIFTDTTLEERVFLSELLRPGTAFESITLNRDFPPGAYEFVVAFTQVEDADGEQALHGQTLFTMNFHVREPDS